MNQDTIGGRTPSEGRVEQAVRRDLGDLRGRVQKAPLSWSLRNWTRHRRRELPLAAAMAFIGRIPGVVAIETRLAGATYRRPVGLAPWQDRRLAELLADNFDVLGLPALFGGQAVAYGTLSRRVVTDTGVAYLVDSLQNLTEPENFKFHGFGTGTTAEAASQTALVTELTTQYQTDNVRPTGSQTEAAANIYRTVGTLSPDTGGTIAITEHGIFSQAATGGGTLLDRSVFSAVNLVAGSDSLQTTYDLTISSGG